MEIEKIYTAINESPKSKRVIYFDSEPKIKVVGNVAIEAYYNYCENKPTTLGELVLSDKQIKCVSKVAIDGIGVETYVCLG